MKIGIKERKQRERDERRELILTAANDILKEEGIEGISIRKIANRIEYSPAIIYHYFKDKDEIIGYLMQRGYKKMVEGLASVQNSVGTPEQKLKKLMEKYIEISLEMPDEYKTVQLSSSPDVVKFTSSLFEGASSKKPALKILFQYLKETYKDKNVNEQWLELTAQIIATASLGLVIRLILEKNLISAEQKKKLIDHHISCIIDGIVLRIPLDKKPKGGNVQ